MLGVRVLSWRTVLSVALIALMPLPSLAAGVFRYAVPNAPESFDPHRVTGSVAINIAINQFVGLTRWDALRSKAMPALALRHEISQDGRRYVFHLRPGLRWSDGAPLTAEDFVYAWRRLLSPGTRAPYAYQMYVLRNADLWHMSTLRDVTVVGVHAPSPLVLEVQLAWPVPYFLDLTALHSFLPLPRHAVEKSPQDWATPGRIVVNGPFHIAASDNAGKIRLQKNPHYYDAANVSLDAVEIWTASDAASVISAYDRGDIDFTGEVYLPADLVKGYATPGEWNRTSWLAVLFLRFQTTKAPLNQPHLRNALNLATDREALLRKVGVGDEASANSLVPAGLGGFHSPGVEKFSPTRARALLLEMGYCQRQQPTPGCKPLPQLEVLNNREGSEYLPLLQALSDMWQTHLGMPALKIRNLDWYSYLETMRRGDYQIARSRWIADYPDPSSFLKLMLGGGGNNRTGWREDAFDRLLGDAEIEVDRSLRLERLLKADTLLAQQMPVLPLYNPTRSYLLKPRVRGLEDNPFHQLRLETVRVDEPKPRL